MSGRVFFFEDVAAYFEPLWSAAARATRAGELPTFALGAWSGQPLLGDPQVGILYPPHQLLWLLMPVVRAYAVDVVLHSVWAAIGAYALCRALGRSRPAAATAGIALALSAYFVLETRHVMFLVSASWMPWLWLAVTLHARTASRRSAAAIAACTAMALLGGGWSMLVFALPPTIVFAVARARWRSQILISTGAAALLGVALASVSLLPALAHAALSPRALPLAKSFASSYAWPSLAYAKTLLFPLAYGDDARNTYVGAPDQWELCGYGMGLVAAVFAAVSLTRRDGRGERVAYLVLITLALLAALGARGPLGTVMSHVPLLSHVRCPARTLFIYTLVVPLLCADGVDCLPRARWVWLVPLVVALELLVTFRAENPTLPLADTHFAPHALAAIPHGSSDGRTLLDVHLGQRYHNGGLRWNIESPGGYSSLPLWRYLHLLWIANHHDVYPSWPAPQLAQDLTAQGLWTLDAPILDLLNVRWLLAPRARPPAGTGWVLEARGDDGIDRWRNDEALPRGFVVHEVEQVSDEAAAAVAIARADFSPRRAIVEAAVGVEPGPVDPATLIGREHFLVTVHGAGLFVLSEPWIPSWTATIDGVPAPVLRVDYALTGLAITDGHHEVRFERVDRPLRCGALASLLALLVTLALCIPNPRRTP
ncbi:MAG: hypothetical protein ABI321_14595 [Polyangia bacterium]